MTCFLQVFLTGGKKKHAPTNSNLCHLNKKNMCTKACRFPHKQICLLWKAGKESCSGTLTKGTMWILNSQPYDYSSIALSSVSQCKSHWQTMQQLTDQLKALQSVFQQKRRQQMSRRTFMKEKLKKKKAEAKTKERAANAKPTPMYFSPRKQLEIFKTKPTKASDVTIQDWIIDVRGQIPLPSLSSKESVTFIRDHLARDARREILERRMEVGDNPDKISAVLKRVFSDGNTLLQLLQPFFNYQQGHTEDLLSCSLGLVTLVW